MDRLFKWVLRSVKQNKHDQLDVDDCVDRLSHRCTVVVLISFAFVVTSKQLVGDPICCWCPAQFTVTQRHYANAICWVSNTYYVAIYETIGPGPLLSNDGLVPLLQHRGRRVIYYQWVPLILLTQAMLSFLPCLVWRFLNQRSGVNLDSIIGAAHVCSRTSYHVVRERAVSYIVNHIDRYLLAQRDIRRPGFYSRIRQLCSKAYGGNHLVTAYVSVKVLYLANAVGQIYLLQRLLAVDFRWFGTYVVDRLSGGGVDWTESERFPRVTLCQFEVWQYQSRVHHYVVQCVLSINLFNEKIFLLVWLWYVVVAIATVLSILSWLFRAVHWPGQVQYLRKQLLALDTRTTHRDPGLLLATFTENYLRRDGNLVLRLVAINISQAVASEILSGLWTNYKAGRRLEGTEKPRRRRRFRSTDQSLNGGKRVEII